MERDELEDLFRRHSESVFRRARAILRDVEAAKDVTQEVFLRAMSVSADVCPRTSPSAWLFRVTTNLCLTRLRDLARRQVILRLSIPSGLVVAQPSLDAALTLQALLRDVPDDLQDIAACYFVDHMSQDEIAELVGLPRRTVGYRLEQFRALVRERTTGQEPSAFPHLAMSTTISLVDASADADDEEGSFMEEQIMVALTSPDVEEAH